MAGDTISSLPAIPSALLTDIFPVTQGSSTGKETLQQVLTLIQANISVPAAQVTGLGQAAAKSVSDNSLTTLASILGPIVGGNVAIFADSNGTLEDGGTLGKSAFKDVSDDSKTKVPTLSGAFTTNNIAGFADTSGTLKDLGATTQ